MTVKTTHPEYSAMSIKWQRCRDVAAGEDAVHAAGETYLPRLKDQDDQSYASYVLRTPFFNATWRTIEGLRGMLFRIPPRVKVPPGIEQFIDDVNLQGMSLHVFASECAEESLKVGRLGVLVDYPQVQDTAATLADAIDLNLRPTLNLYRAEAIINWRTTPIRNKVMLTLVVLQEKRAVPKDEFSDQQETVYRVLDLDPLMGWAYRVRMFRIDKDGRDEQIGDDVYPLMDNAPLDSIPFYFLGVDDTSWNVDDPPLIDLVNMNLAHYRVAADYEHGCHFTGLPTPVISGYAPEDPKEKLYIGSQTAWVFPHPEAKAEYLEFKGQGLQHLQSNLEDKKKQMSVLGARMLEEQKRASESADTMRTRGAGEQATLATIAQTLSIGLEAALFTFSRWGGAKLDKNEDGDEKAVIFELNRQFYPAQMTADMLTALMSTYVQGGISFQTLFENLQAGDIISNDTVLEDEQARIEEGKPDLPVPPTATGFNKPAPNDPKNPQGGPPK